MSASREKKKRQELNVAGVTKNTEPVTQKTPVWKVAVYWLIGIAFVVAFVLVMLFNSSFFAKRSTAVTVGEHKLSPAMVSVYYNSAYNNFYSSYGDYVSYFFDSSKPLSEQVYDETTGQSWSDYFMESAKESMTWAYTLYDQAVQAGMKLTDEEKASIDENISAFKQYATEAGFASIDGYLSAAFGKGVDAKLYREFMEVQYLASSFYADKVESYSFTEDEKIAYYNDHAEMYDTVSGDYAVLKGTADATITTDENGKETIVEPTEEQNAAAMEEARAKAEEMLAGGSDAMDEAEDLRDMVDYLKSSVSYVLPEEAAEWLFDTARVEGDMKIFENTANVYVVRFAERDNHDYLARSIRLVQINAETAKDVLNSAGEKDAAATEEAQKAFNEVAAQETKKLFESWQDGDATEETFIEMVKANSDDATSKENDGLIETVLKSDFTDAVSEWLYDAKRMSGDCKYFTDAGTSCFIIYYVGESANAQGALAEGDLLTDTYNTWYTELAKAYPVTEQSGMRHVTTR
ncbi:MAG: hypothetical protein E7449_05935 [Ruminococcaceae bacterium]|nr:hypothetical protein [Oscillospiraceae bacterium]